MKALTLWQPWASLIAVGAKKIETRSWRPPTTLGRLLICSARRPLKIETDVVDEAARVRIYRAMERHGHPHGDWIFYGKALCVVTVVSVQHTDAIRPSLSEDEQAFGDYSPGRFGWVLGDLRPLARPFDVCGAQGLFGVDDDRVAKGLSA
jgi:hypothetical protein